ncbi:c-type cytochrome [Novosphingobium lentum]|uniref:c-type cytochrome n=1 Tax=Novosphingobium lentum TaxID=145287 RepID=UPI00082BE4D2|nr:cytochrome c [Novosphingobium lentum]
MKTHVRLALGSFAPIVLLVASTALLGAPSKSDSASLYAANCASCHGVAMNGGMGPALTGAAFAPRWQAAGYAALLARIRATMPLGKAGSLKPAAYTAIARRIAAANRIGLR